MDEVGSTLPFTAMIAAGVSTLILGSGLAFALLKSKKEKEGNSSSIDSKEEEIEELDKSKYPGGYITIYYGSQTGTAESFSQDIEREGEDNGFKINVVDLEEIEEDLIGGLAKEGMKDDRGMSRAIFLMATYGEGEPTDNAATFIRFLKDVTEQSTLESTEAASEEKKGEEELSNDIDVSSLKQLEFAVFGLGNRQYEHFNAMGKLVDSALAKGGASRIAKLGLGDDDDDLEGDFENWKDNTLWPALKSKYILDDELRASVGKKNSEQLEKLPECHIAVEYLDGPSEPDNTPIEEVHISSKHYFTAVDCPVSLKRELRSPADDGSTLHVEIDISNAGDELKYQTADNLAILPINEDSVVEKIANVLNYDLGAYFRLQPAKGHESKHAVIFPTPCTIHDCLARYCDLLGPPRRSELKLLAAYAKDPTSKKALLRMSSKEGKAEYKEKVLDAKIGIADIISNLCPSIEMPLEHFISVCPRLQPRYYTISSSSSLYPNSIHATVSVLQQERNDGSTFKGVCSNYLSQMIKDGKVRAFARDSTFRLPSDASKPIIMIGPGTGIAPMRALLQERAYQRSTQKLSIGSNILYFGCKSRSHDFIYSDELNAYEKEDLLTKMYLAFSREQDQKVYVQHLLAKNSKETWELINDEGAHIYVCGGVKMGQDVSEALRKIVSEHKNCNTVDAKKYLESMASNGRFVQELWA